MAFTTDLLTGVAQYLEDQGVGAWRPDGSAYLPAETAIVVRALPQSPDRVVSLAAYSVSDDATSTDSVLGVQCLTRATSDPRDVEGLDDELFDVLHDLWGVTLNGVRVQRVHRQSHTTIGQDGNSRWQSSSNFYFHVHRPAPHRL